MLENPPSILIAVPVVKPERGEGRSMTALEMFCTSPMRRRAIRCLFALDLPPLRLIFLYAVPLYPTADAKKFNIRLCCFTCRYIKNCKVEGLKPFCPSRQKKFESCRRERFGLSWAAGVLHPDEQHGVVLVQRRRAVLEAVFQRSRAHRRDLEAWLALVVLGGGVLLHQVQRGLELAGRHA